MRYVLEVCLITFALLCVAGAQDAGKLTPRPGVQVQMPVASHAVQVRAADQNDATVITIMSNGKLFLDTQPVTISALSSLDAKTVYVKADARGDYQNIVSVLDALRGRSVVLLTAPATTAQKNQTTPPYGVELKVDNR